ncbi:MAG: hypothetical protein U0169_17545 [Polyangiaceae bacterium]
MSKEALVAAVKTILGSMKAGNADEAYAGYVALFSSPDFATNRPEDQRQAIRLLVHAKGAPTNPTKGMVDAHRAALAPLTELVSVHDDPADYEMLGMCHVILGNEANASNVFKAGLAIERAKSPGSDLCGALMRRISLL